MFTQRENEETALYTLRWSGRVLSLMVLFLLALFYLSEGIGTSEIAYREYIGLLFFPIGIMIGFVVGWRNELAGGLISVFSILCFYLVYGLLLSGSIRQGWAFLVFAVPGILFLAYGLLNRIWFPAARHSVSV
jgi:hypothetical protein